MSKLLVTGGTGSFGQTIVSRFINDSSFSEIRIFSRDEKKQDELRHKWSNAKLKFYIGDVRDMSSLERPMEDVDYVFHAAALKQVPSCEFFPMEAVKTNVLGSSNVITMAKRLGVKKVVCLSTDKAAYPINAMGISKAMMEKIVLSMNSDRTKVMVTRYGNVMASRGSVIPLFIDKMKNNEPVTLTNGDMTRFMMTLEDAVDLVLYAFENGEGGELFVQKAPAATIDVLFKAMSNLLKYSGEPMYIGERHGEKLYETLLTREERMRSLDLGKYFKVLPDNRDLNYSNFVNEGKSIDEKIEDYNSHNTNRLGISEMEKQLMRINNIQWEK